MAITVKQRRDAETLIYKVMDALDKTGTNSEKYKEHFSNMSDLQFEKLFKEKFPLKFYTRPFEIEPKIEDAEKAAKLLKAPLLEEVRLPHQYRDKNGVPVKSKKCLVGYIHLRKVQQFLTKKNAMSTNIIQRDMKTGLLLHYDKNGKTSDRETEALLVAGFDKTVDEFTIPKGDNMEAKNALYNTISTSGIAYLKDLPKNPEESLSINLFNTYMIGAHLNSNLLNKEYMTPYTLKNKTKVIKRI